MSDEKKPFFTAEDLAGAYAEENFVIDLETAAAIAKRANEKVKDVLRFELDWWSNRERKFLSEISRLTSALEQSIQLQSHYAGLLNQLDGGRRIQFDNAKQWLGRLDQVRENKAVEKKA